MPRSASRRAARWARMPEAQQSTTRRPAGTASSWSWLRRSASGVTGSGASCTPRRSINEVVGRQPVARQERDRGAVGLDGGVEGEAAEGEGAQVDRDQAAQGRRGEAEQELQRHVRLERAQHGHGRAEHPVGGAAADRARHVGEDGAVAGRAAAEGADIAGQAQHRGRHQRLALGMARVAQDVGRGQAVGAVEDEVGVGHQARRIADTKTDGPGIDLDGWVGRQQRVAGSLGLEPAEIGHAVERLAVQIGFLDPVVVEDGQVARPRRRPGWREQASPRPPAPTTRTLAAASLACPAGPTSGSTIWRA